MSEINEDYPSDTGDDRFSEEAIRVDNTRSVLAASETKKVAKLKLELLRVGALTARGQFATASERGRVEDIIYELEQRTPILDTSTSRELEGRWALVYGSEDASRSSPFFWAFRKATKGIEDPRPNQDGSISAAIFAITDSIPGKSIGEAVQTITNTEIRSEVEVFAGASAGTSQGPLSFPSFRSVMTTTSEVVVAEGMDTTLSVTKTQVRKSAIGKLLEPIFNLDNVEFSTARVLSPFRKEGSNEVVMTTTFLDHAMRVSRNEEGQIFVFVREDDSELP
ncbi:unnamed protein product [Choristocarpus tenellus]